MASEPFAAVFAYEVDSASVDAFESMYGPDGDWARFFRRAAGYLGTDLWCSTELEPRRYLLIDRWQSASAYTEFLSGHEDEYRRRSRAGETIYQRETALGWFEAC